MVRRENRAIAEDEIEYWGGFCLPEAVVAETNDCDYLVAVAVKGLIASDGASSASGVGLTPLCGVRQDVVIPAASVIKTALLLEMFRRSEEGSLALDETVPIKSESVVGGAGILPELEGEHRFTWRELARLMIVLSDNTASNAILNRLGFDAVNSLLRRIGARDTVFRRLFMADAAVYGENETTAADCVRILSELYSGQTICAHSRQETMDILGRQQFIEKIPARLPLGAVVGNKTGELDGIRHDIAVVRAGRRCYALAVLTQGVKQDWEADARIARISRGIYSCVAGIAL